MQCQQHKNSAVASLAPDILPSLVKLLESVRKNSIPSARGSPKALPGGVRAASLPLRVEIIPGDYIDPQLKPGNWRVADAPP